MQGPCRREVPASFLLGKDLSHKIGSVLDHVVDYYLYTLRIPYGMMETAEDLLAKFF